MSLPKEIRQAHFRTQVRVIYQSKLTISAPSPEQTITGANNEPRFGH